MRLFTREQWSVQRNIHAKVKTNSKHEHMKLTKDEQCWGGGRDPVQASWFLMACAHLSNK